MWAILNRNFDTSASVSGRGKILNDLMTARPEDGESIAAYCNRVMKMRTLLKGTPEEVGDTAIRNRLLASLGTHFKDTATRLICSTTTLDDTIAQLEQVEGALKLQSSMQTMSNTAGAHISEAFLTTVQPRQPQHHPSQPMVLLPNNQQESTPSQQYHNNSFNQFQPYPNWQMTHSDLPRGNFNRGSQRVWRGASRGQRGYRQYTPYSRNFTPGYGCPFH